MPKEMLVTRNLAALRRTLAVYRQRGRTVALVPTMGALHAGHLALVDAAQRRADRVVVSIFVNPTQFAPNEDFLKYPRTFARDRAKLKAAGVDMIWAPAATTMYPGGFSTRIVPGGPALAGLEDAYRPHFFAGVCTVVAKLFIQCQPDVAVFGQKDYQQLKVVTRLARDLDLATRLIGIPTKRDRDGLALSSRNAYLSEDERSMAPTLYRALRKCAATIARRGDISTAIAETRMEITQAGFSIDYVEARHADTLAPIKSRRDGPIRLLAAARLGRTRLIDNVAVGGSR
jgi:pantoate--beta-alanine ligase